jgi:hypothetical protein
MDEIAPGLWRWTALHPDWVPDSEPGGSDDWEQRVGSVLHTTSDAAVFIDPLVPARATAFWRWADAHTRGRRVFVLTTIRWHARSRDEVARRYPASVSRAKRNLPAGVVPIVLREAGETMFWLPEPRTLVPGDRILGDRRGGLRLCPDSWLTGATIGQEGLRAALAPVLELGVQRVLVSHGEPVLEHGDRALRRLLTT